MKLSEMFPARFVRGRDLPGPILVQVNAIEREEMHPRPGVTEQKYVLRFERLDPRANRPTLLPGVSRSRAGYGAILRKALAEQIATVTGSDDTDEWIGKYVVLEPCQAHAAGRDVLSISARAPKIKPAAEAMHDPSTVASTPPVEAPPAT